MDRIAEYLKYHEDSSRKMDIDIQVEAIVSLCDLNRLSLEQGLWLSFLFATCYCVPTAFVMVKRIPHLFDVDERTVWEFWRANKPRLFFQTDRAWNKRSDFWPKIVISYQQFVRRYGNGSQYKAIMRYAGGGSLEARYERLVGAPIFSFGRFSWFLFSELVVHMGILYRARGMEMRAVLNLDEAESVKNGVVFALGLEETAYTGRGGRASTPQELRVLTDGLKRITALVQRQRIYERHHSVWSIETTLCAYKKFNLGKRYVGYYAERTVNEINKLHQLNPDVPFYQLGSFVRQLYWHLAPRLADDLRTHSPYHQGGKA